MLCQAIIEVYVGFDAFLKNCLQSVPYSLIVYTWKILQLNQISILLILLVQAGFRQLQ